MLLHSYRGCDPHSSFLLFALTSSMPLKCWLTSFLGLPTACKKLTKMQDISFIGCPNSWADCFIFIYSHFQEVMNSLGMLGASHCHALQRWRSDSLWVILPRLWPHSFFSFIFSIRAGSQNHIHSFHAHFGLAGTEKQISWLQSAFPGVLCTIDIFVVAEADVLHPIRHQWSA